MASDAIEIRHQDDAIGVTETGTTDKSTTDKGVTPAAAGTALPPQAGRDDASPPGPGGASAAATPPETPPPGGRAHRKGAAASDPAHSIAAKVVPPLSGERVGAAAQRRGEAVREQLPSLPFAALLAAAVLAAGGAGAALGAWTAGAFAPHPAPVAIAGPAKGDFESASVRAQLTALKTSLERDNRSAGAQFAKIDQRLDGLEHAQAAPATKLAHISDAIDRLERPRAANSDATEAAAGAQLAKIGQRLDSLEHAQAAQLAHVADTLDRLAKQRAAGSDETGSIGSTQRPKASEPGAPAPVLSDWVLEDVRNGRAMVESRYGGPFMVAAGSMLPGLGRVEQIERQNGRWVVVTAHGLITASP